MSNSYQSVRRERHKSTAIRKNVCNQCFSLPDKIKELENKNNLLKNIIIAIVLLGAVGIFTTTLFWLGN